MLVAPIPLNEDQRLDALHQYHLLDTASEVEYDRVSHIASQLCQAPIAMVSLIDCDRQWVKSAQGITIQTIPREISLCAHTILTHHPLVVEDTTQDYRFLDNPAVAGQPHVVFYAGIPLISSEGMAIGSLCIIDHHPRQLSPAQQMALQALADQAMLLMELRRTNYQLHTARTVAEELAHQKSHLLATLSHEIRTPLHALEGFTQLLIDQPSQEERHTGLHRLQTTGRTLVRLVNNILDYSKLQAGKLELEAMPFSLPDLIQQTVEMQSWQAAQKTIQLTTHLDARLPAQVKGDATRLLQVLLNLVSNALKFTHEGEVNISVQVLDRGATDVTLNVEVSDTGIGIPEKSLALLFNEYTQVSAATARLYGGSGLGLAITRQLLELMDSTLTVRSQEGQGSTFGFRLTVPIDEATPRPNGAFPLQPDDLLLAVDDNPFNTKVLSHQIRKAGGQVSAFHSPLEALESARTIPYRAMLLDLHMPELDGYELAQALRDIQPGVPLVALSADDSVDTLERVKASGFRFFLRKPFLPHELIHILSQLD